VALTEGDPTWAITMRRANFQIEGGPAPKDRVERAVAVPSHRGLSRNLDSDARLARDR
jgi:hypothetical protein